MTKLTCNLTGKSTSLSPENYEKNVKLYGSEENLKKFYIQQKFIKLLNKGNSLEAIANTFGLNLDPAKADFYKELVDFHRQDKKSVNAVETKVNFLKTDEKVLIFLKKLASRATSLNN